MTFWKHKPLGSSTELVKSNCDNSSIAYRVKHDITDELVAFINENYNNGAETPCKFVYSSNLLMYYLKNGFWLEFYSKKFQDEVIAVVCARYITVCIKGTKSKTVEINLVCLKEKLRGLGVFPVLIELTTNYILSQGKVDFAMFTRSKEIPGSAFSRKNVYYLKTEAGVVNSGLDVKVSSRRRFRDEMLELFYQDHADIYIKSEESLNKKESNVDDINEVRDSINELRKDIQSLEYRVGLLEDWMCPVFYDYSIDNSIDFVRIYMLDYEMNGQLVKNACIYSYFLQDYTKERFTEVIYAVAKKLNENGIELITIQSHFDLGDTFFKGGEIYYYFFNKENPQIQNSRNYLITI